MTTRKIKGVTPWSELREKVMAEPGAAEDVAMHRRRLNVEMHLADLRRARQVTQVTLAELLGVDQSAVSQQERRADHAISTLRDFVEALGGHLHVTAVFEGTDDEEDVEIPLVLS